jgi:membrane protease subunit HflK
VKFLFEVRDVAQAVRDASETVTRRIVGNMDFDYVLSNREILAANAKQELQGQMDAAVRHQYRYLQLLDINPPRIRQTAFNEVNVADQDMKRLVNEAEKPTTRSYQGPWRAKQIVEEARVCAERINRAMVKPTVSRRCQRVPGAEEVTDSGCILRYGEVLPRVDHLYFRIRVSRIFAPA